MKLRFDFTKTDNTIMSSNVVDIPTDLYKDAGNISNIYSPSYLFATYSNYDILVIDFKFFSSSTNGLILGYVQIDTGGLLQCKEGRLIVKKSGQTAQVMVITNDGNQTYCNNSTTSDRPSISITAGAGAYVNQITQMW